MTTPTSEPPKGSIVQKSQKILRVTGVTCIVVGVVLEMSPAFSGAGLITSAAGVCFLIGYFGLKKQGRYWPIASVLLGVGLLGIVALFLYLCPHGNCPQYQARARQSEARVNLGNIFNAETMFYKEHRRYGTFEEIGFKLDGTYHRYTYRIDVSGKPGTVIPAKDGTVTPDNTVVPAGYSATGFTVTATANIDNDPTLDQWHVNDQKQGLDKADVNDVTQ